MENIEKIDTNFALGSKLEKKNIKFYDSRQAPFELHGVFYEGDRFRRMPENVAKTVSPAVYELHGCCSGGRVRFRTDSPYVAISCRMPGMCRMPFCSFTGLSGFDMYEGTKFAGAFVPPFGDSGYEEIITLGERRMRDITINFPTYSQVNELYIGLDEEAVIESPSPYRIALPVVYYGSSITQGACVSRPGLTYQNIISRRFDCDYISLGFSGSAMAEKEISEYIKNLEMSLFVYDYDHNAPTVEHLRETHERMFEEIRNANPTLPIIMMPRPKSVLSDEEKERRSIVEATYRKAVASGDKNVYFITNEKLTELCGDNGTVEGTHPNDFGFASMAKAVVEVMEKIFER